MVQGIHSPGETREGCEAGHSLPTSAEIKETRICSSTPLCHHGVVHNLLNRGKSQSLPQVWRADTSLEVPVASRDVAQTHILLLDLAAP
jgi:hypothetical protein